MTSLFVDNGLVLIFLIASKSRDAFVGNTEKPWRLYRSHSINLRTYSSLEREDRVTPIWIVETSATPLHTPLDDASPLRTRLAVLAPGPRKPLARANKLVRMGLAQLPHSAPGSAPGSGPLYQAQRTASTGTPPKRGFGGIRSFVQSFKGKT